VISGILSFLADEVFALPVAAVLLSGMGNPPGVGLIYLMLGAGQRFLPEK
jgi:hypothetical protein